MPYGTLNVDKIVNDNGVTFAGLYGFKNRIINGDMRIDQRNAGASFNNAAGAVYGLDRWATYGTQAAKFSCQRSAVAPAGFTNSSLITSLSAYSVLSSDSFLYYQNIEGFNIADLGWGAAGAQSITLSFWVRSSLTGTFGGAIQNAGAARSYPFTYTISAANTWEQKTVTVAGDTSGTWGTGNGLGIAVVLGLGVGSTYSGTAGAWAGANYYSATGAVSVVGTNGATFYITGVQLEKGSTATSFDYRPYGTEVGLCQRYYCKNSNIDVVANNGDVYTDTGKFSSGTINAYATNNGYTSWISFPVAMRAAPTITYIRTNLGGTNNGMWTIYDIGAPGWESPSSQTTQSVTAMGFMAAVAGTFAAGSMMWYGAWTASIEL